MSEEQLGLDDPKQMKRVFEMILCVNQFIKSEALLIPATQSVDKFSLKSKVQSILLFKTVQEVTDIMQYIATKRKIKIRLIQNAIQFSH